MLDFERKVKWRRIDVFFEDAGILIENKSRVLGMEWIHERQVRDTVGWFLGRAVPDAEPC